MVQNDASQSYFVISPNIYHPVCESDQTSLHRKMMGLKPSSVRRSGSLHGFQRVADRPVFNLCILISIITSLFRAIANFFTAPCWSEGCMLWCILSPVWWLYFSLFFFIFYYFVLLFFCVLLLSSFFSVTSFFLDFLCLFNYLLRLCVPLLCWRPVTLPVLLPCALPFLCVPGLFCLVSLFSLPSPLVLVCLLDV
jgi:hypothetical protein